VTLILREICVRRALLIALLVGGRLAVFWWRPFQAQSRALWLSLHSGRIVFYRWAFVGSSELLDRGISTISFDTWSFDQLWKWPSSNCLLHPARTAVVSARLVLHGDWSYAGTYATTSHRPKKGASSFCKSWFAHISGHS
jgi:hypothetical protein